MKLNLMQVVRLVLMVLAVAGIIYALEYVPHGIAVWFWVALLGVGFVGLLYTFRLTQRRLRPGAARGGAAREAPPPPFEAMTGRLRSLSCLRAAFRRVLLRFPAGIAIFAAL